MHILPFRKELLCSHGSSDSTASRNAVQKRLRTGRMKQDGARFRACPWKQMRRQRRPRQAAPDARRWGGRVWPVLQCKMVRCSRRWSNGDKYTLCSSPTVCRYHLLPTGWSVEQQQELPPRCNGVVVRTCGCLTLKIERIYTACVSVYVHMLYYRLKLAFVPETAPRKMGQSEYFFMYWPQWTVPFKFQLRRVYTNYNYGAQFYVAGVHARKRSMLCLMARSY
jgi:hypothetical protein